MPKKQPDPCIFCGGLPCTCDGGTKKKSSPRTRKASSATAPTTTKTSQPSMPLSSATAEDAEDVYGEVPTAGSKFKTVSTSDDVDLSFTSALRVLRHSRILTEQAERQIDRELKRPYPQAVDKRLAEWTKAHGTKKPSEVTIHTPNSST